MTAADILLLAAQHISPEMDSHSETANAPPAFKPYVAPLSSPPSYQHQLTPPSAQNKAIRVPIGQRLHLTALTPSARVIQKHTAIGTTCFNCGTKQTPLWRRSPTGETICNACGLYLKARGGRRPVWLRRGGGHGRSSNGEKRTVKPIQAASEKPVPDNQRPHSSPASPNATESDWPNIKSEHQDVEQPLTDNIPSTGQVCSNCKTTTTPLWRRSEEGQTICNACGLYYRLHRAQRPVSLRRGVVRRRKRCTSSVAPGLGVDRMIQGKSSSSTTSPMPSLMMDDGSSDGSDAEECGPSSASCAFGVLDIRKPGYVGYASTTPSSSGSADKKRKMWYDHTPSTKRAMTRSPSFEAPPPTASTSLSYLLNPIQEDRPVLPPISSLVDVAFHRHQPLMPPSPPLSRRSSDSETDHDVPDLSKHRRELAQEVSHLSSLLEKTKGMLREMDGRLASRKEQQHL
ncbi:hypothetical protein BZG36_00443 [Bifiguratus adelaidae]|uniref:GATA-type domain-containing protein n=1 Tax=Bifiguratus adelaidae TaxID=1938954 RepID=A0A261Y7Q9_9FUNG|nr:hypothetical protein BZG36_00443 [Bifiguratus adelaidae]